MAISIGYKIFRALASYRCQHTFDGLGDGARMVDILTPPGEHTITNGQEEMELLADHIAAEITDEESEAGDE